jgi:anti-anti-sigma factor
MTTLNYESLSVEISSETLRGEKVQIISFRGKITHQNANLAGDELENLFDDNSPNVIVDLSELEYINSVGLAVILSLVRRVEDLNGKFGLGGRHKQVETIVNLLDVSDHVRVFSSLEEAKTFW